MENAMIVLFIGAWFIQMGAHEGAHAYAASACGDDTSERLGKKSFNPFNHVEWNNLNSIFLSVLMPVITAIMGLVPMGMAWVPVNPRRLNRPSRDMAFISFAGPLANLLVVLLCFLLHFPFMFLLENFGMDGFMRIVWIGDRFLQAIAITSLVYGIFNLIPVPPLDGSKVLRHFLPPNGKEVLDNLAQYGLFILFILFYASPLDGVFSYVFRLFAVLWS